MEEFKADIIQANKKGRLVFYSLLSAVLLAIAALIFLQVIPIVLQVFSIAIWLFAVLKYFLQSKKQILKKTVGELIITREQINIFDEAYNLSEIKSIRIFISGWKSYKRSNDRQHPVSDLNHGDENFLTILFRDKKLKVEFMLRSKEHWQQLREHVISWHCKDLNLIEESGAGKTYGLQLLNYKEIQDFKNQIRTSKTSAL